MRKLWSFPAFLEDVLSLGRWEALAKWKGRTIVISMRWYRAVVACSDMEFKRAILPQLEVRTKKRYR